MLRTSGVISTISSPYYIVHNAARLCKSAGQDYLRFLRMVIRSAFFLGAKAVVVGTGPIGPGDVGIIDGCAGVVAQIDVCLDIHLDLSVAGIGIEAAQDDPVGVFDGGEVFISQAADDSHRGVKFYGQVAVYDGDSVVFAAVGVEVVDYAFNGPVIVVGNFFEIIKDIEIAYSELIRMSSAV